MEAIPDPVSRQDFEKIKYTCDPSFPENVGPGHEDLLTSVTVEDSESIHQGILVVNGKYDRLVFGDFFPVYRFKPVIIKPVINRGEEVE